MQKSAVLLIGLTAIGLSGFSSRASRPVDSMRVVVSPAKSVVAREWKGRVAPPRAEEYYRYLLDGVSKMRAIKGSVGVEVLRRDEPDAVGFTVISYWVSREAIKAFAGDDIEMPHHLPKDREYLLELPTRVLQYDLTYTDLAQVRVRK